jgi:hypothetical protein
MPSREYEPGFLSRWDGPVKTIAAARRKKGLCPHHGQALRLWFTSAEDAQFRCPTCGHVEVYTLRSRVYRTARDTANA